MNPFFLPANIFLYFLRKLNLKVFKLTVSM